MVVENLDYKKQPYDNNQFLVLNFFFRFNKN